MTTMRDLMNLVESAGRESVGDVEERIFTAYCKKHRLDVNAFMRMDDAEIAHHRAAALADRNRYPVPITEPGYLYHGTAKARLTQIAHEGLKPFERSRWTKTVFIGDHSLGRVFLTDTVRKAEFYASEASKTRPAILRVRRDALPDMQPDPKEEDGSYYIERTVPPEQIEVWTGKGWSGVKTAR